MGCNCITEFDAKLAEHNSRLQVIFPFGAGEMTTRVRIGTEKINTRNRTSMGAVATFCPFCGERYAPNPNQKDSPDA